MSRSHHLYIATDGKIFKIGRTNDVKRRCKFRDMLLSIAGNRFTQQAA